MNDYDTWEGECARLLDFHGNESVREQLAKLLDQAAREAASDRLDLAARTLESVRRSLVARQVFRRWDDGILVFSSLIRQIRGMSAEPTVPASYQRFLDAIPSTDYWASLTKRQTAFWYGSPRDAGMPDPLEPGRPPSFSDNLVMVAAIVVVALLLLIVYGVFFA